jgi:hypothetical protein
MKRQTAVKYVGLLLAALALWAVFSWPLPRHFSEGIPSSDHNVEKNHIRTMIPGDHLQLAYHFWLASDMIAGKTPLFTNVYEFNRGVDKDLHQFDPYYMPYSLVFAACQTVFSKATAWNFAGLLSIFCTFFATYVLLRRLTCDSFAALISALLATSFPYRWITLLTGSPTGFAISLIPLTVLGLHIAITDNRWSGGLLAGLGIFFSYCSDLHVFYFNTLSLPFWVIAFALLRNDLRLTSMKSWKGPFLALLPTIVLTMAAALTGVIAGARLSSTDMASGRSWNDIIKYSARSRGLFSWENLGMSNHVFLGHIAVLLALISLIAVIYRACRNKERTRPLIFFALVFIASLCVVSLSLGANGIGDGIMMRICRKVIPKYTMIRQAVKINCLMPLFLSVITGLGISALSHIFKQKRTLLIGCVSVLAILCIAEWRCQISPSICLLADSEPAYEAVALDAESRGVEPRAVVVPLWPGDSHWSSIYEHYVALYRVRMLNGYSPAIGDDYFHSVFRALESINQGVATPDQISLLRSMKIDYLIFHEDAFPEKVSPYPASQTLFMLLAHPSLELLKQSESIWAFRILSSPRNPAEQLAPEQPLFSTRGWEMEHVLQQYGTIIEDSTASGTALMLTQPVATMDSHAIPAAPGQQLNLRVKGEGSFSWRVLSETSVLGEGKAEGTAGAWKWIEMKFDSPSGVFPLSVEFFKPEGDVLLDVMFLTAGKTIKPAPGESVTIPATAFFRAGYTDISDNSAILRASNDPDLQIFYALLPFLDKATYKLSLDFEAAPNMSPGNFIIEPHAKPDISIPIESSSTFECTYEHWQNVPVRIGLEYSRNSDVRIRSLTIERLK